MREPQSPTRTPDAADVSTRRAERFALLAAMRRRFVDLSEEQIQHDVARVIAEVQAEARDAAADAMHDDRARAWGCAGREGGCTR